VLSKSIRQLHLGGSNIMNELANIVGERGYGFNATSERALLRDITHKLAYVALNYDAEMNAVAETSNLEKSYTLPGKIVTQSDDSLCFLFFVDLMPLHPIHE
jgi:hypothetical protein